MYYIDRPVEKGITLRRNLTPNGPVVETNVPHNIVYHSPTGFEWGYAGSGPADLALNLAELVVTKAGLKTDKGIHCSTLAWKAKLNVKELLIMHIHESGGFIPWKLVCYAVLDRCDDENRKRLQRYIDKLGR